MAQMKELKEREDRWVRPTRIIIAALVFILLAALIVAIVFLVVSRDDKCGGAVMKSHESAIMKYFNLDDGIELRFAHAVNSEAKLNSSLNDSSVLVLEADVIMDPVRNVPVMAHPPATSSDLTLEEFLNHVWTYSQPKGVKLDFKQIGVVESALKILDVIRKKQSRNLPPMILNADILVGPENPMAVPVNASRFLDLCRKYDQTSTLSPGWTTTKAKNSSNPQGYTWEMVKEMNDVIKSIDQPITFPVRASLVGISQDQLLWLLNLKDSHSLTVWHSNADKYDVKSMAFLRTKKYIKKVYYDLPDAEIVKLKSIPVSSS